MISNVTCPKCGSVNCERLAESDAPPDGVNTICKECGELFNTVHLRFTRSRRIAHSLENRNMLRSTPSVVYFRAK